MEKKEEIQRIIQEYRQPRTSETFDYLENSLKNEDWEDSIEQSMEQVRKNQATANMNSFNEVKSALLDIRIVLEK